MLQPKRDVLVRTLNHCGPLQCPPNGADTSACTRESFRFLYDGGSTKQSNILSSSLQIIYTNSRHFWKI